MTITTPIKPVYKTINDERYGELTIRPFGATEELRLEEIYEEATDAIARAEKIEEEVKNNPDGVDEKAVKEEITELRKKSFEGKKEALGLFKRIVTGEKADLLFEEMPIIEIRKMIDKVLKDNG